MDWHQSETSAGHLSLLFHLVIGFALRLSMDSMLFEGSEKFQGDSIKLGRLCGIVKLNEIEC